jgi:hypothetical protein
LGGVFGVEVGLPIGGEHGNHCGGLSHQVVPHGRDFLFLEVKADLALRNFGGWLDLILVVVANEGLERDGDWFALEVFEEFPGDERAFWFAAGTPSVTLSGFDKRFAVDVNEVAAAGADVVAIVDHHTVSVTVFERWELEGASHEEDFFFPKGVDGSGAEAIWANASIGAFGDGAGGDFAIVVAERTLGFIPTGLVRIEVGGEPIFHSGWHGDFAVAGDELVKGDLLGGNGIEGMVGPFGGAEVGEHGPVVFTETSPVIESGKPVDDVALAAGAGGLGFGGSELTESDAVFAHKFWD